MYCLCIKDHLTLPLQSLFAGYLSFCLELCRLQEIGRSKYVNLMLELKSTILFDGSSLYGLENRNLSSINDLCVLNVLQYVSFKFIKKFCSRQKFQRV